jgi:hypothetical protein
MLILSQRTLDIFQECAVSADIVRFPRLLSTWFISLAKGTATIKFHLFTKIIQIYWGGGKEGIKTVQ